MNEVKNAAVENIARVTEIFDTSIASKKVIQCKEINNPKKEYFKNNLKSILKLLLEASMYSPSKTDPINIRCQTITSDVFIISSPKIAVNPAIKTKK